VCCSSWSTTASYQPETSITLCRETGRVIGIAISGPDLLLIYAKPSPDVLRLVTLGSHSDLFE
jgi:hypothetical protein